jgi:Mce-associated membrane protein
MKDLDLSGLVARMGLARLVALTLGTALLVLAAVLVWQTQSTQEEPVSNRALIDEAAGEDVSTFVARALTQVFSYDWAQPDATRQAADTVLSGQARTEYDTLYADLQARAPGQKLTLSAEVQVAGVQELTQDKATLLVFVDQASTRAQDEESSFSAAQLSITVERTADDVWAITALEPL